MPPIATAADLRSRYYSNQADALQWDPEPAELARRQHHHAARQLLDSIESERRDFRASEQREYDGHLAEIAELDQIIDTANTALRSWQQEQRYHDEARDRARAGSLRLGQRSGDQPGPVGTDGRSLVLPSWSEYRALSGGTGSAGGYFVPTRQAGEWFDMLRNKTVFLAAGPRIIEMDDRTITVPKIGASVTAAMIAENAQISPTDETYEQVTLTAKKLAALTLASNESLDDSSPGLREVVQADHFHSISALLDKQFLEGSGSGANIRGLRNLSGVTVTALDTNGRAPTIDDVADAITRLERDNSDAKIVVFMHGRTWGVYRKIKDTTNRYLLEETNGGAVNDVTKTMFGKPVFVSNQLSITETVGTSTDCSWIGVVDMDRIAVGRRAKIKVDYSADYRFDYDQTAIRSVSRWDMGCLDEEAVEILTGVRT